MKQMNDTQSDIDSKSSRNRLFSAAVVCLSIMASSTAIANDLSKDDNDSIVRAMYGFIYPDNSTDNQNTDDNIIDLSRSKYGTAEKSTAYSNEIEYKNFLSNPIYLNNYFKSPKFSGIHANLSQPVEARH